MKTQKYDCVQTLQCIGVSYEDATALRRISMTLHAWHEGECGNSNDYASWAIVRGHAPKRQFYRDPETQAPAWKTIGEFTYDDAGKAYIERHAHTENKARYTQIQDREAGAIKRLKSIMSRYPGLGYYVQGDPRGAALYILRAGDVPAGCDADAYYSRGIVVCK